MDNDRKLKLWDVQDPPTDNPNIRTQMAKVFVTDNQDILEYTYVKNAMQEDGFECGDLCFAIAIELFRGKDAPTIEFASPDKIRCHTCNIDHRKDGCISKIYIEEVSLNSTQNNENIIAIML